MDNYPLLENWRKLCNSVKELRSECSPDILLRFPQTKILAVSKAQGTDKIRVLAGFGQKDFGENYLQEALEKIAKLADLNLQWHFIGQIQSRKLREIVRNFSWIHTVTSLDIVKKINQLAIDFEKKINICIQINTSGEQSKGGIKLSDKQTIFNLVSEINNYQNITLRGLMTIPAPVADLPSEELLIAQRKPYRDLAEILNLIKNKFPHVLQNFDTLSMGMSDDYRAAILEGASIVRIGTLLFGKRL